MLPFTNQTIDLDTLPKVEELSFQKLEPAYLKLRFLRLSLFFGALLVGQMVFFFLLVTIWPWLPLLAFLAWLGLFGWGFLIVKRAFDLEGFVLREHDLVYRRGVLWKTEVSAPFNRVQHTEVEQGILEKAFGLSTLHIFTAGGSSSDLSLAGLLPKTARQLAAFITPKTLEPNAE